MRGPIDYIIVGFEGNRFTGKILKELQVASDNDTISVLALALISKDENGVASIIQADADTLEIATSFSLDNSLITDDDIAEVGDILENNTAAGLLIIEHLWAKSLKQAIKDAGGFLVADGRIHPDAEAELNGKEDR